MQNSKCLGRSGQLVTYFHFLAFVEQYGVRSPISIKITKKSGKNRMIHLQIFNLKGLLTFQNRITCHNGVWSINELIIITLLFKWKNQKMFRINKLLTNCLFYAEKQILWKEHFNTRVQLMEQYSIGRKIFQEHRYIQE